MHDLLYLFLFSPGDMNKSNNARHTRPVKRSHAAAAPKRHVSFVSDRTAGEDTLADISTRHQLPGEEAASRTSSEPHSAAQAAAVGERSGSFTYG